MNMTKHRFTAGISPIEPDTSVGSVETEWTDWTDWTGRLRLKCIPNSKWRKELRWNLIGDMPLETTNVPDLPKNTQSCLKSKDI